MSKLSTCIVNEALSAAHKYVQAHIAINKSDISMIGTIASDMITSKCHLH